MPRWLLPEGISDILPSEARKIEELRRRLLDLYRGYGYELVMPPLLEHLDALLTGTGGDLDLRTFKLVDQLSGRTLGLRADMTPQVARIDAHLLGRQGVVRLCYAGSVLHTRPTGVFAGREPLQVGAELYGHAGLEADLEAIELAVASLRLAGVPRIRLDLAHPGVLRALLARAPALSEAELLPMLLAKDGPALRDWLREAAHEAGGQLDAAVPAALMALPTLYGPAAGPDAVPARARALLPAVPGLHAALDELERLAASPLLARFPEVELAVDLADLRGWRYHSGATFAAYVPGQPDSVARGGRYDNVGRSFGRARPATGFSLELRELAGLVPDATPATAVRAPWSDRADLAEAVARLRAAGEIVVQVLPGHEHEQQEFACDRELVEERPGAWTPRPLAVRPAR
jgi:ATP phosphoribosyltransferase regulatory subunit